MSATFILSGASGTGTGTALIEAVQNEDRTAVAELLGKKIDVNARDDDGGAALSWASVRCNVYISKLLLGAGADPNLTNEQGIGPLYLAITNGASSIVRLLLEKGVDPNI